MQPHFRGAARDRLWIGCVADFVVLPGARLLSAGFGAFRTTRCAYRRAIAPGPRNAPENTLAALRTGHRGTRRCRPRSMFSSAAMERYSWCTIGTLKRLASVPLVVSQEPTSNCGPSRSNGQRPLGPAARSLWRRSMSFSRRPRQDSLEYRTEVLRLERSVGRRSSPTLARQRDAGPMRNHFSRIYKRSSKFKSWNPKLRRGFLVSTSLGDITRLNVQLLSVSRTVFNDELRRKAIRGYCKSPSGRSTAPRRCSK